MIADKEIEQKAAEFHISPVSVEKDYVYGWLLKAIYDRPQLAPQLVLKGGQALRKAYLPQTRFSKDLDFSALAHLDFHFLERELRVVCAQVSAATGVQFLDKVFIKDKELPIQDVDALEVRLYFRGFYGEENLDLRAQLDVTQFDKVYLPVQTRGLLHAYSDAPACAATIQVQKLEEILASKLTALLHRRKPVDLFDLLYAILVARDYPVSRLEVVSTFLKKSIFGPQPNVAKEQLLAIPLSPFEGVWSSLIVPAVTVMAFSFVTANFHSLVDSLFSLLAPSTAAVSRFAVPMGLSGRSAGSARRLAAFDGISPLAVNVRQALMSAAHNEHMVEMIYEGIRRLVEPYKLEYYVRKSDGHGSEYFWGWDTSGGKSGKIGIKQFFCHKITAAVETDLGYVPRYPVLL